MPWLIKEAVHALDSIIGGRGLAHSRVMVKVVSKPEPQVLQELYNVKSPAGNSGDVKPDNVTDEQWGLAAELLMDLA